MPAKIQHHPLHQPSDVLRVISEGEADRYGYRPITNPLDEREDARTIEGIEVDMRGVDAVWIRLPDNRLLLARLKSEVKTCQGCNE